MLFVFSLFSCSESLASSWGMNDVSILLPLPAAAQISEMLAPSSDGGKGPLLPNSVYNPLGNLMNGVDAQTLYTEQLKVIGIRIDPCFKEGISKTLCRRQIRLVWQPVFSSDGEVVTGDAAIHTFYDFQKNEWPNVLAAFEQIASRDLTEPLQIHPKISSEGYTGATWMRLRKIILNFCGANHLSRVTATRLNENRMWTFLGFNQTASGLQAISIPNVPSSLETFVLTEASLKNLDEFNGRIAPSPVGSSLLPDLLQNSIQFKSQKNESDAQAIMKQMIQVENPKLNNSGTVDCVSCHLSQTVKFWGLRNFPNWNWGSLFQDSLFSSTRNLQNNSVNGGDTNHLRAFGYEGIEPMISERVINETAKVSEALSVKHSNTAPILGTL